MQNIHKNDVETDMPFEADEAVKSERVLGNCELPIARYRNEIEQALYDGTVTILVAPTGSGKTTQVPQFARELGADNKPLFDEIIVTQPRIVAAREVSKRVSEEMAENSEYHSVGYYTSKESSPEPQHIQHIAFLTDGKAAAQLLHDSHGANRDELKLLIIDEVHEWNINIELLIALAAAKTNPENVMYDENLKIVIMSATIDAQKLRHHFEHASPRLIHIDVPMYEVTRSFSDKPIAETATSLVKETGGIVLAFMAGKGEIKGLAQDLEKAGSDVLVIPLHGQQSKNEQSKAFIDYPGGAIIATTNAAETSLTVPGVAAVVDSGEVRVDRISYDIVSTGSSGLFLEDAPQSSINQRAGRAGRLRPGQYVLSSATPYEERDAYATPSIQRSSLDGLMLRLISSGMDIDSLSFIHKPPQKAIEAARQRLYVLKAIDSEGAITERGKFMERLPLDPEYGCMVAFAYEQNYNDDIKRTILDIAAIMQRGGVVKRAPKEQLWRNLLARNDEGGILETDSDLFAQLEVYAKLCNDIPRSDWKHFDIIEHSADLVEQDRACLSRLMRLRLDPVKAVAQKNRQAVLTCIHAGQLNQIWQDNGETWSLLLDYSDQFELSHSSVVKSIGKLATGNLFTLGSRSEKKHALQNMNSIVSMIDFERAAEHLISDSPVKEVKDIDALTGEITVSVERKLGSIVLRTAHMRMHIDTKTKESEQLRQQAIQLLWKRWAEQKPLHSTYTLSTIDAAIASPEHTPFGIDPLTGETLFAWLGGSGWCITREVAIESLLAYKNRLVKHPEKVIRQQLKRDIKAISPKLTALLKGKIDFSGRNLDMNKVEELAKRKHKDESWLEEARALFVVD